MSLHSHHSRWHTTLASTPTTPPTLTQTTNNFSTSLGFLYYWITTPQKTLVNLKKFATEHHTSPQLAFKYKRRSNKKLLYWKRFLLISRERSDRIFLLFDVKCIWPPERILKSSLFHFKGFAFKSTSNTCFEKVWWKSENHIEIRNHSKVYLEPRQRSMIELLLENS